MSNFTFSTPAKIRDFADNPDHQALMDRHWDLGLLAYTQAANVSNPWTVDYQAPCDWYVNPAEQDVPQGGKAEPIFWTAFPNRLKIYFSENEKSPYKLSPMQVYALGDFGNIPQSGQFETGLPTLFLGRHALTLTGNRTLQIGNNMIQMDQEGGWTNIVNGRLPATRKEKSPK